MLLITSSIALMKVDYELFGKTKDNSLRVLNTPNRFTNSVRDVNVWCPLKKLLISRLDPV